MPRFAKARFTKTTAIFLIKSSVLFERDTLQNVHTHTADYVRLLIKKFTKSLINSDNLSENTFCVLKMEMYNEVIIKLRYTRCFIFVKK